jgi:uncharacterized protein (DUF433 family)
MTDQVIVKDRDILGGVAVFKGTRVPFQTLLDYLEGGSAWRISWMTFLLSLERLQLEPSNGLSHS